jgi:hypothetical protein
MNRKESYKGLVSIISIPCFVKLQRLLGYAYMKVLSCLSAITGQQKMTGTKMGIHIVRFTVAYQASTMNRLAEGLRRV